MYIEIKFQKTVGEGGEEMQSKLIYSNSLRDRMQYFTKAAALSYLH